MIRDVRCLLLIGALASVSCSPKDGSSKAVGQTAHPASSVSGGDAQSPSNVLEGLWQGSWGGGGGGDGTVFQPVIAEMVIIGDQIEIAGFPALPHLAGTAEVDAAAGTMRITPSAATSDAPTAPLTLAFAVEGDIVTITLEGAYPFQMQRHSATQHPFANTQVDLVWASLNDTEELVITEFMELRAGLKGTPLFEPFMRTRPARRATMYLVKDDGVEKIERETAMKLLREPALVAISYRQEGESPSQSGGGLWQMLGPPIPDGKQVSQTWAKMLRPGTLVFVLPAENEPPQP